MKKHFTISLIILVLALIIAIGSSTSGGGRTEFLIGFGLTCCIGGALCLLAAAFIGIVGRKPDLARAFLLAAGITFLLGTGVCSTLLL